jgi:GT2 family glycosyltransferase
MTGRSDAVTGASTEPGVWAVVLNYQGADVLGDCLRSLSKQDYSNLHILVVDNASTDGAHEIAEGMEGVELIRNEKNLLFAGGNNVGIRRAIDAGADHVVLLNNDTVSDTGLISGLVSALEDDEKAGIAGPKIYYHEQPDVIWSAGGGVDFAKGWVRHRGIRRKDTGQFDAVAEVDYVTGCCLMFKREVYSIIGGLDESFPLYYEDTDFCTRARKAGYKVLYVPDAKMWHKVSYSSGGEFSWRKANRRLKAGRRFFGRHSTRAQLIVMPFWQVVEFCRVAWMLLVRRFSRV